MRQRRKISGKSRTWGWTKFVMFLGILVMSALISGFITFANAVKSMQPPSPAPKADGIVVLTGKGGGRLEAGAKLLKEGRGERLFISGVNTATSREDILSLLDLPEDLSGCCLDLDYAAEDTVENAKETAAWSTALGYEHIILVTSAYHIPRSRSEIRAATGRIKITAYPVSSDLRDRWWTDKKSMTRLLREYGKLLVTIIRRSGDKKTRETPISDTELPAE